MTRDTQEDILSRKSDFIRKKVETLADADPDIAKLADEWSEKDLEALIALRDVIAKYPRRMRTSVKVLQGAIDHLDISVSTFYRKRAKYEKHRTLSCLISKPGSGGRGIRRIPVQSEKVIQNAIRNYPKVASNILVSQLIEKAQRDCKKAGTLIPSDNTVRSMIYEHPMFNRSKGRFGGRYAKQQYDAHPEYTPPMSAPLERIQIDHTLVDIIVADSQYRIPLGRPWVTIAIDEYTRAILGFVLSFSSPSATTNAYCMTRVVLPKKPWLDSIGVTFKWLMQGLPYHVYVDNGMDLKANALIWGCLEHGIAQPEHRAPGIPHTGGYIESVIGTFMGKMRLCSSNTTRAWQKKKTTFNPEEKAEMTLQEVEYFLATMIAGDYHTTQRAELDEQTPNARWEKYFDGIDIFGNQTGLIVPQPRLPPNPDRFIMDFLPRKWRTIRNSRVNMHGMSYWSEALRYIIRSNDAREYEFRWSHQDVSSIYWKDPKSGQFIKIQNRHGHKGPIELYAWKLARARLVELGKDPKDEEARFRAYEEIEEMQRQASIAKKNTKGAKSHRKKQENMTALKPIKVDQPPTKESSKATGGADIFSPSRSARIVTKE